MDALFADSGFGGSAARMASASPAPPAAAAQASADPLDLFGGTLPAAPQQAPAPSQPQQTGTLEDLLGTGDLLGGFGPQGAASRAPRRPASQRAAAPSHEAHASAPLAAGGAGSASTGDQQLPGFDSFSSQGQPPVRTAGTLGSGGFGDFLGTEAAHGVGQATPERRQQQAAAGEVALK